MNEFKIFKQIHIFIYTTLFCVQIIHFMEVNFIKLNKYDIKLKLDIELIHIKHDMVNTC